MVHTKLLNVVHMLFSFSLLVLSLFC